MSRKRVSAVALLGNGISNTNSEDIEYEYYRPGCYYIPQVTRHATPYSGAYMAQWQPCCNTATYVIDRYGRAFYPSDFEHQFQVPSTVPIQREVIYHYYNDGDVEISSIPQIEEDDFDEQDVSPRKVERFDDQYEDIENCENPPLDSHVIESDNVNNNKNNNNNSNIYRAKEGYLVEEPNHNDTENM